MKELNEICNLADTLCGMMDKVAGKDVKFCDDICYMLEQYSQEVFKIRNYINEIKYYVGA